jgi:lysozyme
LAVNLERLRRQLIDDEDLRLKPYVCPAGKTTIGVGRNLDDRGISSEEADLMFRNDLREAINQATRYKWFGTLSDARQEVVVNMLFNLGPARFGGFRNMIKALEQADYALAADEMRASRWFRQVGKRAVRLAQQMETDSVA